MGLEYFEPVEQKFKYREGDSNRFFTYDLKLVDKKSEQEIFLILRNEKDEKDIVQYPHIEFTMLVANLATNDQEKDIMVVTHDTPKLVIRNAIWGSEAYFTIRKEISRYPNAKLVSFYREGLGMVSILYCFDNPDLLPLLFSFQSKDSNKLKNLDGLR